MLHSDFAVELVRQRQQRLLDEARANRVAKQVTREHGASERTRRLVLRLARLLGLARHPRPAARQRTCESPVQY